MYVTACEHGGGGAFATSFASVRECSLWFTGWSCFVYVTYSPSQLYCRKCCINKPFKIVVLRLPLLCISSNHSVCRVNSNRAYDGSIRWREISVAGRPADALARVRHPSHDKLPNAGTPATKAYFRSETSRPQARLWRVNARECARAFWVRMCVRLLYGSACVCAWVDNSGGLTAGETGYLSDLCCGVLAETHAVQYVSLVRDMVYGFTPP